MGSLRLGWRNLWRNRRRTLITLAAVTLNTAILIASYSLMEGFMEHTVSSVTNMVVGEAQVHADGYLLDHSIYKTVVRPGEVLKRAEALEVGAAERLYGYGLVSSGTKSAGALFWGVDPEAEKKVFALADNLETGKFLAAGTRRGAVLGRKMARSLNAGIGSEIVVVVQAADGSLGNDLYKVTGILKAVGETIDRSAVIIPMQDFRDLFVMPEGVHEIALNSRGRIPVERLKDLLLGDPGDDPSGSGPLFAPLPQGDEVKTWKELMPALADMLNIFDASLLIFGAIFFLAAGLGVMNTMLMATYERTREFGVLKALGTAPWRIVVDVAGEALLLCLAASVLGALLGLAGCWYLQEVGINTAAFAGQTDIVGVAFDPVWRGVVNLHVVIMPIVIMCAICLAASLYPATLAARLDPVEAMNHV